jgi:hypothetical protein
VQLLTSDDLVREEIADRLGRFSFDAVAPGPVRLAVIDPDGNPHRDDRVDAAVMAPALEDSLRRRVSLRLAAPGLRPNARP